MKRNLVGSALILSCGAIGAKLCSAIYRIVLTRILGGEGIGLYQLIFPFYSLCVILSTAGIPLAVSKVIAKHPDKVRNVLKKSMVYVILLSVGLGVLLAGLSGILSKFQGNENIKLAYVILSFGLVFVGFSSVIRGYFQGIKDFTPSAISTILEQFFKLMFGLFLAILGSKKSLIGGVIGAVGGIVISEILTAFILLSVILKNPPNKSQANCDFKTIMSDVFPIMLYSGILPFVLFVDSILIVNLLFKNFGRDVSIYFYGLESGAVATIVNLPTLFSMSIAGVILPIISQDKNKFNTNSFVTLALKLTLIVLVPMALGCLCFPREIITLLYHNRLNEFGYDGVKIAARLLMLSSSNILLLGLNQVVASILQSKDKRLYIILSLTAGVIAKIVFEVIFVSMPNLNIYAVPISNMVCYVIPLMLNLIKLLLVCSPRLNIRFICSVLFASLLSLESVKLVLAINASNIAFIIGLILAGLVYLMASFWLQIFDKRDLCFIKYKIYK